MTRENEPERMSRTEREGMYLYLCVKQRVQSGVFGVHDSTHTRTRDASYSLAQACTQGSWQEKQRMNLVCVRGAQFCCGFRSWWEKKSLRDRVWQSERVCTCICAWERAHTPKFDLCVHDSTHTHTLGASYALAYIQDNLVCIKTYIQDNHIIHTRQSYQDCIVALRTSPTGRWRMMFESWRVCEMQQGMM